MVNLKSILSLTACVLLIFGTQLASGQPCPEPTVFTVGNITLDPCNPQRISIPVYMQNPCAIGGFSLRVFCTDPSWLSFTVGDPNAADTIGSRIQDAQNFTAVVLPNYAFRLNVTTIANIPPGDGLVFTMHMNYRDFTACDTSQLLNLGDARVSSPDGYYLYDVILNPDYVYILPGECHDNPRADANCNGVLNGIDVIYLVNFLKGVGPSYCCVCSGDANNSDSVNGIDITFLINYFKGGAVPPPCD